MVFETFGHIELTQGVHKIVVLKERDVYQNPLGIICKLYILILYCVPQHPRGGEGSMYTLKKLPGSSFYMPFSPKGYGHWYYFKSSPGDSDVHPGLRSTKENGEM